jgi:hypothetical protein
MMAKQGDACPLCGFKGYWFNGRHTGLTPEQIEKILVHFFDLKPKVPIKDFCKQEDIGRGIYWRVTRLRIGQEKDREKIIAIAESLGYDILAANKK